MTFLGDMTPKDISDYVERCEDSKLIEHERAEAEAEAQQEDMQRHNELGYCPACDLEIDNADAMNGGCDCYCHQLV